MECKNKNIRVKELHSGYQNGSNASHDNDETVIGECTTKTVKSGPCNSTNANFDAVLITLGDYIKYEITVTNSGTLDGVLSSINLNCSENNAIACDISGMKVGKKISKNGGKNTFYVTIKYKENTNTQPANVSNTASIVINYQQDLGQVAEQYDNYSTGDTVEFANGDYYIVVSETNDYVTLLKQYTLSEDRVFDTNTEYGYTGSNIEWYLNNEFLPTITNDPTVIWDENSSVRLLTWDEFNSLVASSATSHFTGANSGYWWITREWGLRALVYPDGTAHVDSSAYANGVRPVIIASKNNIK